MHAALPHRRRSQGWGAFLGLIVESGLAFLCVSLAPRSVFAGHTDILVQRHGGRLEVGSYDFADGAVAMPLRVFTGSLAVLEVDHVGTDDPGFNALAAPPSPYQALPPGIPVKVLPSPATPFAHALAYWNGVGAPRFTAPPSGQRFVAALSGAFGPLASFTIDDNESAPPGFGFATTGEGGQLHQHLQWLVFGPEGGGQPPATGAYLLSLALAIEGLEASPPFFVLLNHGLAKETFAGALVAAREAAGEPEPESGGCAMSGRPLAPAMPAMACGVWLLALCLRIGRRRK